MDAAQKIALGGRSFALAIADGSIARAAEALFGGYAVGAADWPVRIEGRDPRAFPAVPSRDLVCERVGNRWRVQLGAELEAFIGEDGATAWVAATADFFAPGSLQNLLRLCLVCRGVTLLHACGVVWRGRAFVFAGKSGAGKSTLARCFDDDAYLGDEIICIDGGAVFRAPFTGERLPPAAPLSAPLGAVVLLDRGALRVEGARAIEVLPHVLNPTHDAAFSRALVDRALSLGPVLRAFSPLPDRDRCRALLDMVACFRG